MADAERLQAVPLWAKRHAQNRTLASVIQCLIFAVAFGAFAGLPIVGVWAHRQGLPVLTVASGVLLVVSLVGWVWYCVGGARWVAPALAARLYGAEGAVTPTASVCCPGSAPWVAVLFVLCVGGHVVLGLLGVLPNHLIQPISALYMVPFLVWLWLMQQPRVSPFLLMWPALYAIHAGLLLAGAPIRVEGPWDPLNMLVPTIGYGLVAGLAGHLYSRHALRRLRQAAALPPKKAEGQRP
jgi:hypothetical protein